MATADSGLSTKCMCLEFALISQKLFLISFEVHKNAKKQPLTTKWHACKGLKAPHFVKEIFRRINTDHIHWMYIFLHMSISERQPREKIRKGLNLGVVCTRVVSPINKAKSACSQETPGLATLWLETNVQLGFAEVTWKKIKNHPKVMVYIYNHIYFEVLGQDLHHIMCTHTYIYKHNKTIIIHMQHCAVFFLLIYTRRLSANMLHSDECIQYCVFNICGEKLKSTQDILYQHTSDNMLKYMVWCSKWCN